MTNNDDLDIFACKRSFVEVTEEEWAKIREGMKPNARTRTGGTSMTNELIFSIKCEPNETLTDVKCKLANISYVLNDAVTFDVVHVHNERVCDGVSTVIDVRMTYPTLRDEDAIIDERIKNVIRHIDGLDKRLTSVENESAEHREIIEELDSQGVFGYADEIDGINTRLDNLSKTMDNMRVNSYRDYKALQDTKEKVSELSNRVESLEEDNRELQGKPCDKSSARSYDLELISKKVMDIDKLDENLADLKKIVDTLRTNVSTDYSTLNKLRDSVRELNGDMSSLMNNYIGVSNRIDILEKTIDRQCIQRRKRH